MHLSTNGISSVDDGGLRSLLRTVAVTGAMALGLVTPMLESHAQGPVDGRSVQNEMLPSIELPEVLDRVLRDYEQAWRANDPAALAALFTSDGFVLQPGRLPARGRAALEEVYRGQGGGPLRLRALAYAAADTVAYIIGAYRYGDAPADQGKFTLTLRLGPDRRWLIASDMDNGSPSP